jgi:adenosylmethionine-8-amino-7-oxononanoate aminotransferase
MLAPPFIVTEGEIDMIVDRFQAALMTAGLTMKGASSAGVAAR